MSARNVGRWKRPRKRKGQRPASSEPRAFRVRFRIKGETEGPTYEGQKLVKPCRTCGGQAARKGDA